MSLPENLTLHIKGMVCDRCVRVLKTEFEQLGLQVEDISLGSVRLSGTSRFSSMAPLREVISKNGFELLADKKQETLQQAQTAIHRYYEDEIFCRKGQRLSTYLNEQLNTHYESLSHLFSSHFGMTLENYAQQKRLEKVKEMLVYTQLSLTEIALRTGFSSVNHLSNHFKSKTGLPPSHFRKIKSEKKHLKEQ